MVQVGLAKTEVFGDGLIWDTSERKQQGNDDTSAVFPHRAVDKATARVLEEMRQHTLDDGDSHFEQVQVSLGDDLYV